MKKITAYLPSIMGIVLLLGGGFPWIPERVMYIWGIIIGGFLVLAVFILRKKLAFPKNFWIYLTFLLLFSLSIFWSLDRKVSFNYLLFFLGGGLFWLSSYNLKDEQISWLPDLIVILGLSFLILFLVFRFSGDWLLLSWSLVYKSSANHIHLGDYWVLVMLVVIWWMTKKARWWHFILIWIGTVVIMFSSSRSAILAFFVGIVFFIKERIFLKKKFYYFALALLSILFIFEGGTKTTLFSRPYYIQTIAGVFHRPFGVGVGNFLKISSDKENQIFGASGFSIYAHSIVFEILAGMGILGLIFAYWLIKVLVLVLKKREDYFLIYKVLFLALSANFLFDYSYTIPSMFWLWFLLLGFAY
jgi:hypothetical protein